MQTFTKPNIIPFGTIMNTTFTSVPIPVQNTYTCAIQLFFTGTPTGTFTLQASCDTANLKTPSTPSGIYTNQPFAPTNWSTIANSSQAVTTAGDILYNVQDLGYNWIRVMYTDTSGGTSTATITDATFNAKNV